MIHGKLVDGRLPHDRIPCAWGGPGNGETCDQPDKGVNVGWYANPKVDKLLDQAREELNDGKRAGLYRQVDKIIMEEDAAYLPICNDLNLVVLNPKVKGFINPPEEWFQLSTPWVEKA